MEISKKVFRKQRKRGTKICHDPQVPTNFRKMSLLTSREREVFELLVHDVPRKEIAKLLFISEKTVRLHISNVMKKLNVKGISQAVVELVRLGELTL